MASKKLTTILVQFIVFLVAGYASPASAVKLERCIEFSETGDLTCTVEPHFVEPWLYKLPGHPRSTGHFLSEEEAIAQRISDIKAGSENLCSEVTYDLSGYDETWQF
ncbi:MAG: hypothetical protein Q8O81_03885, partial [Giesbergeria sp.]|nr:hypothetical protein [Giesbergeria sp.]